MGKDFKEIKDICHLVVSVLSSDSDVKEIFLFGSYARGDANIQSDIDIAIIHNEHVSSSFFPKLRQEFLRAYNDDIHVQFSYLTESAYLTDNHILNIAKTVREEGISLWKSQGHIFT